jgi:DNA-directed RNA polymerase III subunit RPC3
MQEIARTHDHAPSRTNYLWRVDCSDVEKTVKRELIQALTNVHLRKLFEVRRYRTGIVKNERMWSSKPLKREVLKDLEVTTMRLDELLLLFDDVDVASQTV